MRKNTEYTLNEVGKIESLKVAGKPVKASFLNALKKAQGTRFWRLVEPVSGYTYTGQNPFSGVEVELSPFEYSVYSFCLRWYSKYEQNGTPPTPISVYDNMRYLFLEINPDAYMDLLD